MKRILIVICLLCILISAACTQKKGSDDGTLRGRITISGAWALYPMAVHWASEFKKLHPDVRIDVSAGGAGKGMTDALARVADLGMVSREVSPAEVAKGAWYVAVVKDAVVPTVNEKNPLIDELSSKGAKRDFFQKVWLEKTAPKWGAVAGRTDGAPVSVFTRSDACGAAETWAGFLGKKQEDLQGIGVYGDPGVAEAVRNDANGIGYNNVNYAYDTKTGQPVAGLRVLPIDLNGDGTLDEKERFYDTTKDLVAAIGDGRYPSPPARDLYFVAQGKPDNPIVRAFLEWVLTQGQRFVAEDGYVPVTPTTLAAGLEKVK